MTKDTWQYAQVEQRGVVLFTKQESEFFRRYRTAHEYAAKFDVSYVSAVRRIKKLRDAVLLFSRPRELKKPKPGISTKEHIRFASLSEQGIL